MAWTSCNLGDLTVSPADLDVFYTNANYKISGTGNLNYTHIIMNIVPKTFFTSRANTFILGDATNGIKVNPASGNYWLELWHNNSRYMYLDLRLDWGNQNLIVAGYDDVTQKGTIYNLVRYNGFSGNPPYDNTYDGIQNFTNSVNNSTIYEILKNINIPEYTWQSVSSVSGKNGILSLAQIKDEYINEGESVSGASSDHFTNLSTENRVDVLINDALPDPETGGTTVTVKYTIPNLSIGSYEYCKLVAKKNSIPEGPEDGDKIIDVNPSLTSIVVRGLDELSTYYFVIFVEDDQGNTASSEPKSCKTGISLGYSFDDSYTVGTYTCSNSTVPSVIQEIIKNNEGTNTYMGEIAKEDISPEPSYSEAIVQYCGDYPLRGGKYPGGGNQIAPDPREIMPQMIGNGTLWFGYSDSSHSGGGLFIYDGNDNEITHCSTNFGSYSWGYWAGFWGFIIPDHGEHKAILLVFSYVASDKWYWRSTENDNDTKKTALYNLVFGN